MTYYRSTAYIITQGFQKVLICYFTIFLWITMNFQSSYKFNTIQSFWHYSHESWVSHLDPKQNFYLHVDPSSPSSRWTQRWQRRPCARLRWGSGQQQQGRSGHAGGRPRHTRWSPTACGSSATSSCGHGPSLCPAATVGPLRRWRRSREEARWSCARWGGREEVRWGSRARIGGGTTAERRAVLLSHGVLACARGQRVKKAMGRARASERWGRPREGLGLFTSMSVATRGYEVAVMQAARASEVVSSGECQATRHCSLCTVSTLFVKFQISNSTSNIPLKPILCASVTPKLRWVSKNSINKSCRSTYQLQLLLNLQSLIRPS
jgi:hypothetical protein